MSNMKSLVEMELCNLYGFNVFRHTKDKKAKRTSILLGVTIVILMVLLMVYVGGLSYGLVYLGLGSLVPAYLTMIASLITLALGIFKTGATIFRRKGYDMLASLPVSNRAVVFSRFIRLYVESLVMTVLVMAPGLVVYGILTKVSVTGILMGIFGILCVPLLPVSIASFIGAIITGISSRMKNKAMVEIVLTILFVVVILGGSSLLSANEEAFTMEMLTELADKAFSVFEKIYPPALWLGAAVSEESVGSFFLFIVVSVSVFFLVVWGISLHFHEICRGLFGTTATHDYQMEHLQMRSVTKALLQREWKRYFSSGVYVTNTIMGPIMGTIFCVGLFFIDFGVIGKEIPVEINWNAVIPFIIAAIFSLMNPAVVSISMEGKEWWIVKTLPLRTKDILDGKVLFGLCVVLPFLTVSELLAVIALQPNVMEFVWLLLIPVLFVIFTCVCGVTVNLKLPKMEWETEVSVVKQSAASFVGGIAVTLGILLCAILVLLIPAQCKDIVCLLICIVVGVVTALLYRWNNRVDLKKI